MKAVVKYAPGPGNIDVLDVDEPVCGANQVKVEIAFCGVCGTDLHVLHDTFRNYPPVILGYECAGTVVEVGPSVTGVNLGDRVTILGATAVTCGHCTYCRSGHFIFCKARRGMGHGVNGGFARYVVVRPDQLYTVPQDNVPHPRSTSTFMTGPPARTSSIPCWSSSSGMRRLTSGPTATAPVDASRMASSHAARV